MLNQHISAARTSDRAALLFRLEELEEWTERGVRGMGNAEKPVHLLKRIAGSVTNSSV